MTLEAWVRRFIPSVSKLTYHPLVRWGLDLFDLLPRLMFRELRRLPPNHLRVRVGVGNRLFANHVAHQIQTAGFWATALAEGWCGFESTILDLGSGCGRYAQWLRDLNYKGPRFRGRYIGVDIDEEALDWCAAHFDRRFVFHRSSHGSSSYRPAAPAAEAFVIPEPSASVDFILAMSLFTHLLEAEADNYLREAARLLRPGGLVAITFFCLDYPPPTLGGRHSFRHVMGRARVESLDQPTAAVAYDEAVMRDMVERAGLVPLQLMTGDGDWQPLLLCRRPDVQDER